MQGKTLKTIKDIFINQYTTAYMSTLGDVTNNRRTKNEENYNDSR